MVSNKHPFIAREGWAFIAAAITLSGLGWFEFGLAAALPPALVAAALVFLFRDPERKIPASPLGVVCPVDGVVTSLTKDRDPCLDREAFRITIQMNRLGGYSIRCPIEGKVAKQGFLADAASHPHSRYAVWLQTDEADDVIWVVESPSPRRPHCYVQPGERVGQGQRCGFVFLGGVLEVYVPLNSRIAISEGDAVVAGESLLSTLIHHNGATISGFDSRLATGG